MLSKYLDYVQASLADASRLAPDLTSGEAVEVGFDALLQGQIDEHSTKALYFHAKAKAQNSAPDDRQGSLPVLVCARVLGLERNHGRASDRLPPRLAPIAISARLTRSGQLLVDDKVDAPVVVPRDLLEPTTWEVTIATVDDADRAYAELDTKPGSWGELIAGADRMLQVLADCSLLDFSLDGYVPLKVGVVLLRGPGSATFFVESLVERLRTPDTPPLPLLQALVTRADDQPLISQRDQLAQSRRHVAQMNGQHKLAESQREALLHHLADRTGTILAVDGPPGTGKTTLLLSVIANAWVEAALREGEPPIVVAASCNNQAVLNILREFSEIPESTGPLSGRWIGGLQTYGLYLPSRSSESRGENFPVHALKRMGKDSEHDAQAFETADGHARATTAFLEHARRAWPDAGLATLAKTISLLQVKLHECAASTQRAVDALCLLADTVQDLAFSTQSIESTQDRARLELAASQRALADANARVAGLKAVRQRWTRHCAAEPWWMSLLAAVGLQRARARRDGACWAELEVEHGELLGPRFRDARPWRDIDADVRMLLVEQERLLDKAREHENGCRTASESIDTAVATLRASAPLSEGLGIAAVQAALDKGPRYAAFTLATHYWEARYLQDVDEQLRRSTTMDDTKRPDKLLRQYRRLAKLFPCFVSTLFTLPHRLTGYDGKPVPLIGAIDLLIVDEAGQVPPEIGAPSFALAQRALVVGDVDQIKPIGAVPRGIDSANAQRHGLIPTGDKMDAFHASGLSASSGSLMRVAQRATPFSKHPQRGRGMFLREHRRCWPEIIAMCNRLVYDGLLLPCRDAGPRRIQPSVGYVHLHGVDARRGGSRCNDVEAAAIAGWLALRRPVIESAFRDEGKAFGELVAVITPFAAQSRVLRRKLDDKLGKDHGVTVGTIHALQGAQRRVVIFSPTHGLGTEPGKTYFDSDCSFLNVAISRAQDAFLIFGNMHLFRPEGTHPSAVVGQTLFGNADNEITDVPAELLLPGFDMAPAALIRTLEAHRALLKDAFTAARARLVIVSPYVTAAAIDADDIARRIADATKRGVRVVVVSDPALNKGRQREFECCLVELRSAGAQIRLARSAGVHSKLVLVDMDWLAVGSFNWLSAARDRSSSYARHESSLRYDGPEACQMIGGSLRDLSSFVGEGPPDSKRASKASAGGNGTGR